MLVSVSSNYIDQSRLLHNQSNNFNWFQWKFPENSVHFFYWLFLIIQIPCMSFISIDVESTLLTCSPSCYLFTDFLCRQMLRACQESLLRWWDVSLPNRTSTQFQSRGAKSPLRGWWTPPTTLTLSPPPGLSSPRQIIKRKLHLDLSLLWPNNNRPDLSPQ